MVIELNIAPGKLTAGGGRPAVLDAAPVGAIHGALHWRDWCSIATRGACHPCQSCRGRSGRSAVPYLPPPWSNVYSRLTVLVDCK